MRILTLSKVLRSVCKSISCYPGCSGTVCYYCNEPNKPHALCASSGLYSMNLQKIAKSSLGRWRVRCYCTDEFLNGTPEQKPLRTKQAWNPKHPQSLECHDGTITEVFPSNTLIVAAEHNATPPNQSTGKILHGSPKPQMNF